MVIQSKPVDWFKPDPNQPRKSFPEQELRSLGESMLTHGQLYAGICRSNGSIVDMERRWRAAQLVGITHLDVYVTDDALSPSQIIEIQLATSQHRAGLGDYELYLGYTGWKKLNPQAIDRELARRVSRDPSGVSQILSLDRCIPIVQEAAKNRQITASFWYAISKFPPDQQEAALNKALSGSTRDELRSKKKKLKLPFQGGQVVITSAFESLTDIASTLRYLAREATKAEALGYDAKSLEKMLEAKIKGVGNV